MNNQRRSRESSVWFPPPQLSSHTPFSPHPHFHHTLNPTPTTPSFSRPFPSRAQRKTVYARPRRLQPSCCPQRPVSLCVLVYSCTHSPPISCFIQKHTHTHHKNVNLQEVRLKDSSWEKVNLKKGGRMV